MSQLSSQLVFQLELMRRHHPTFRCRITHTVDGARLVCRGKLQPTPLNETYDVRLDYTDGKLPRAWIEKPTLRVREGHTRIPHTFRDTSGPRPCLFFKGDWKPRMSIATSVVPWLMLWLVFYETWLATGIWQGEGHTETSDKAPENAQTAQVA